MRRLLIILLMTAFVFSLSVASAELAVKLTVEDYAGSGGKECVTSGVPLRPGQCMDPSTLRLTTTNAKGEVVEVPAQFRVLARWHKNSAGPGPKDGSIRWVLVDFVAGVGRFQKRTFTLRDGRAKPYDSPLKVSETAEAITVTTGAAEFVINRKAFNLFDRVRMDVNGDGQYTEAEECVSPRAGVGSVVEDTYGQKYYASEGVREVKVEESGPVRVCIVAKGVHRAPDGKGYSRGMYQYDTRLHFYAGKSLVKVDHVLNNCFAKPVGTPTFEDHSLVVKLNMKGEVSSNPAAKDRGPLVMYAVYGMAPDIDELRPGQSVCLYQDSNGSETWRVNPGVFGPGSSKLSTFRGYRILRRDKGKETVVTQGDRARGVVEFHGERFGLVVVPRDFWKMFPKAIEVGSDGTARIGVLPREYSSPHWVPDAAGAGQELWLHFYARKLKGGKAQYPRDGQTRSVWWQLLRDRPWPHVIADGLLPGRVALCTREHYAATGALADLGPYLPIKTGSAFPWEVTMRRYLMTDRGKGNSFGWQVWGTRWEESKGHSPANYEPIGSSDYLFRYINTQHPSWFKIGRPRGMQYRNCRAFKIDDGKRFSYSSWSVFRGNAECEDYCGRGKSFPKDAEAKKYSVGLGRRSPWELANPAHNSLDELHDLYLLFGDQRALEGMESIAAVGGYYVGSPGGKVKIHRATGWCFRSLLRYYELTGDEQAATLVGQAMDNAWTMVTRENYRHMPRINYDNTWFYNVFGRAVILAYQATGDERMRDLAIGMTQMRTSKSGHPALNSFSWEQTGHKKYRSDTPEKYARLGGYFLSCDGYRWARPRADKVAPAAVKNLQAVAGGGGTVMLAWTATGDDGDKGTASVYQVKWSEVQIVDSADHASKCNFWAAENVPGEPKPRPAGTKETFVLRDVKPGTYTFALKVRDELNNESAMSNVVKVEVK